MSTEGGKGVYATEHPSKEASQPLIWTLRLLEIQENQSEPSCHPIPCQIAMKYRHRFLGRGEEMDPNLPGGTIRDTHKTQGSQENIGIFWVHDG